MLAFTDAQIMRLSGGGAEWPNFAAYLDALAIGLPGLVHAKNIDVVPEYVADNLLA